MSRILLKTTAALAILAVLNIPIFSLIQKDSISKEQPDSPIGRRNAVEMTNEDFLPGKEKITTKNSGLNGISFLVYNENYAGSRKIRLQIYPQSNLSKPIVSSDHTIGLDHGFSRVTLKFDGTEGSLPEEKFLFVVMPTDYADDALKDFIGSGKSLLNARPAYKTDSILEDVRHRTSQYKPTALKGHTLFIAYIAFNIVLLLLVINALGSPETRDQE